EYPIGSERFGEVHHFSGIYHVGGVVRFGLAFPLVIMPVGKRSWMHAGQRFLLETFYPRRGMQFNLCNTDIPGEGVANNSEFRCRYRIERYRYGCKLLKADVQCVVRSEERRVGTECMYCG